MITTATGAKKLESTDNWREIFDVHNDSVDAEDKLAQDTAPIVNGNKSATGAASGEYVLVRNSSITGITDGVYKAAAAIPANTAIDSTYLTAISGGIANDLNSRIKIGEVTSSCSFTEDITGTNTHVYKNANTVHVQYQGESKTHAANDVLFTLPTSCRPSSMFYVPFVINNTGYGNLSIATTGAVSINQVANGASAGRIYASFDIPLL